MNGILKKVLIAAVAIPAAWEGLQWAAFRTPKSPPLNVTIRHNLGGFKPEVAFSMNKDLNLRTLNWSPDEKPAGAIRILCLGGESTYGQFQDGKDTWWGKLQQDLEKNFPGRRIQIAANGLPHGTSLRAAKWLSEVAPQVKPDIIIASVGAGDLFYQPVEFKYRPNRLASMASTLPSRSGLREMLLNFSQTARSLRASNVKREGALLSQSFDDRDWTKTFKDKQAEYAKFRPTVGKFRLSENDPRTEYLDALQAFQDTAIRTSAKLIVTGEPMLLSRDMELMDEQATALLSILLLRAEGLNEGSRVESGWFVSELRRFQEGAQEWATKAKVPFTDLNGKVPRTVENFANELLLTDAGASVLAAEMLTVVTPVVAELVK